LRTPALARLIDVDFWKNVAAGRINGRAAPAPVRPDLRPGQDQSALPSRVAAALAAFPGQVLVVLAGADPVAHEFARLVVRHQLQLRQVEIAHADHRFASREWRDDVATRSANWIMSW
jgi:hypothetical protein